MILRAEKTLIREISFHMCMGSIDEGKVSKEILSFIPYVHGFYTKRPVLNVFY